MYHFLPFCNVKLELFHSHINHSNTPYTAMPIMHFTTTLQNQLYEACPANSTARASSEFNKLIAPCFAFCLSLPYIKQIQLIKLIFYALKIPTHTDMFQSPHNSLKKNQNQAEILTNTRLIGWNGISSRSLKLTAHEVICTLLQQPSVS